MAVPQTRDELLAHLQEQLDFLRVSSALFDQGHLAEAKRLAVTMWVLLYDTSSSTSLRRQLGLEHVPFFSTAGRDDPRNFIPQQHPLVSISHRPRGLGELLRPAPQPATAQRLWLPFPQWWNQMVLTRRRRFSRQDLVRIVTGKDGGAHVDPAIPEDFFDLRVGLHRRLDGHTGGTSGRIAPSLGLVSLWQMAFEVVTTFEAALQRLGTVAPS